MNEIATHVLTGTEGDASDQRRVSQALNASGAQAAVSLLERCSEYAVHSVLVVLVHVRRDVLKSFEVHPRLREKVVNGFPNSQVARMCRGRVFQPIGEPVVLDLFCRGGHRSDGRRSKCGVGHSWCRHGGFKGASRVVRRSQSWAQEQRRDSGRESQKGGRGEIVESTRDA